ncbi:DNA polymerase [Xinfangfangia sp. CPCC 101601]|uniref:DNA polymerase I n=1 Tax=Pseudogemmobacter lacusdianii TaxID=3069608 RepID=A0ABU0VYC7_9RHOB|nr:DNA polymerase [Xinfangfangia sp. CPCC 101601]MDQ2066719.1 DNA polymerase [Xinfangfangia sp. CPCC 101601]
MTELLFADCEGDNFLDDITKMWTFQLASGVDGTVEVYADQKGFPSLNEGLERMKSAEKVVFHNAFGFDFFAINKLYPGTLRREQIIDTLIISRLMDSTSMRHNLAELGEGLGFPKGHHTDFSRFSAEMVTYGKQDVRILQEAWKGSVHRKFRSFGKFYEEYKDACELEFYVAYCIEKQRQHGFRFDYDRALELEAQFRQEQRDFQDQLQEAFPTIITPRYSETQRDKATGQFKRLKDDVDVFNPGSRDQIAQRLIAKYDWKPKAKTPKGKPQVDETILEALPYPEAKLCAAYMKTGKKLGMIADGENAWLKLATQTNTGWRLHGQINTLGARTHRMSHFKPNMAQVDSDHRLRELFLPDLGDDLVGVDAEGLELRMLAHFLAPYDGGSYADTVHNGDKKLKTDIHSVNQRAAGLFSRDSAKTMIYAFCYGAGDAKLGQIMLDDLKEAGEPAPKASPSKLGAGLRAKLQTGITGLGELVAKCKRTHQSKNALPGLDGRWIPNLSDHAALNTLLQGNGSIIMKKALIVFDEEVEVRGLSEKVSYCANVHDEFQLSVDPDYSTLVAEIGQKSITRAGELLKVRCPLVGSADIGKSWADTH